MTCFCMSFFYKMWIQRQIEVVCLFVCVCVGLSVLCSYTLQVGLPSSQGDVVAVAAPHWLNTLSTASVPFIPVSRLTHSSQ